jgi:hypothetical protein
MVLVKANKDTEAGVMPVARQQWVSINREGGRWIRRWVRAVTTLR